MGQKRKDIPTGQYKVAVGEENQVKDDPAVKGGEYFKK